MPSTGTCFESAGSLAAFMVRPRRGGHAPIDLTISPPESFFGHSPKFLQWWWGFILSKPTTESGCHGLHFVVQDPIWAPNKPRWINCFDKELGFHANVTQVIVLGGLIAILVQDRSLEVRNEVRLYRYTLYGHKPEIHYVGSMHVNEGIMGLIGWGWGAYMVSTSGVIYRYEVVQSQTAEGLTQKLRLLLEDRQGQDMQLFIRRVNGGRGRLWIEADQPLHPGPPHQQRMLYYFIEVCYENLFSFTHYVVLEGDDAVNALGHSFALLEAPEQVYLFTGNDYMLRVYLAVQGVVTPLKVVLEGETQQLNEYRFPESTLSWDIKGAYSHDPRDIEIISAPISGGIQYTTMAPCVVSDQLCYRASAGDVIDAEAHPQIVSHAEDQPSAVRLRVEIYQDGSIRIRE